MKTAKINRDDMLELTRRMTLARNNFSRIAGCYVDNDGEFDGSFNTSFLKLSAKERNRNLEIAKRIPFSETNKELLRYRIPGDEYNAEYLKLLFGLLSCGLKNDALLDVFYDITMEKRPFKGPYAIFVFYGSYDIPRKSSAGDYQGESEEVYNYLICAICPLKGEYEPGEPVSGFLYPAFSGRSADTSHIDVFQSLNS